MCCCYVTRPRTTPGVIGARSLTRRSGLQGSPFRPPGLALPRLAASLYDRPRCYGAGMTSTAGTRTPRITGLRVVMLVHSLAGVRLRDGPESGPLLRTSRRLVHAAATRPRLGLLHIAPPSLDGDPRGRRHNGHPPSHRVVRRVPKGVCGLSPVALGVRSRTRDPATCGQPLAGPTGAALRCRCRSPLNFWRHWRTLCDLRVTGHGADPRN